MTHGQCDARLTVTFPVAEHHRPLAGTKLYCLVTEAHGCEQLAQSCCLVVHWPGVEPATSRSRVRHANHYTTKTPQTDLQTDKQLDIQKYRPATGSGYDLLDVELSTETVA